MKKQTLIQHVITFMYGMWFMGFCIGFWFHFNSVVFNPLLLGVLIIVLVPLQSILEETK